MRKSLFNSITAGIMVLCFMTACAEDGNDTTASEAQVAASDAAGISVMDQPVDFSTPENVEKTMQKIREQEGDAAYDELKNAMEYIKFYDLSVGSNTKRLHGKLNGKTPNEIIKSANK